MIWPSTLANAALFETLHSRANPIANGWRISRYRFFFYVFLTGFCWYWFPGYIFTALSSFAFIAWAAPNNFIANNLFGVETGLGLMPVTFDWSQIAYNGSPLVVPFWAQANVFAGFLCFFAIAAPIIYYKNVWYSSFMPLSSSNIYDNTGAQYNGSRIIDSSGNFVEAAYKAYSPVFMPATFALGYGTSFAVMSCLLTHILLYHTKDIMNVFRNKQKKDCHARMIEKYPDVPWWWYGVLSVIVLALTIVMVEVYHVGMPVWVSTVPFRNNFTLSNPITGRLHRLRHGDPLRRSCGRGLRRRQPQLKRPYRPRRDHLRLPSARQTHCHAHLQVLCVHRTFPSHELLLRYEARAVHEDPKANPLSGTAAWLHTRGTVSTRRAHLDARAYRGRLFV